MLTNFYKISLLLLCFLRHETLASFLPCLIPNPHSTHPSAAALTRLFKGKIPGWLSRRALPLLPWVLGPFCCLSLQPTPRSRHLIKPPIEFLFSHFLAPMTQPARSTPLAHPPTIVQSSIIKRPLVEPSPQFLISQPPLI